MPLKCWEQSLGAVNEINAFGFNPIPLTSPEKETRQGPQFQHDTSVRISKVASRTELAETVSLTHTVFNIPSRRNIHRQNWSFDLSQILKAEPKEALIGRRYFFLEGRTITNFTEIIVSNGERKAPLKLNPNIASKTNEYSKHRTKIDNYAKINTESFFRVWSASTLSLERGWRLARNFDQPR